MELQARLGLSVELPFTREGDVGRCRSLLSGLEAFGFSSYVLPSYSKSGEDSLAAAKHLPEASGRLVYTQTCRGLGSFDVLRERAAFMKQLGISRVLAVTGDDSSGADMSVFELIRQLKGEGFLVGAALVFTRNREHERVVRKLDSGVAELYTQPVFTKNARLLIDCLNRLDSDNMRFKVWLGVFVPFSYRTCRRLLRERPDFVSDSTFLAGLRTAEGEGGNAALSATVAAARANLEAALRVAESVRSSMIRGVHFYGLTERSFGKTIPASELLRRIF